MNTILTGVENQYKIHPSPSVLITPLCKKTKKSYAVVRFPVIPVIKVVVTIFTPHTIFKIPKKVLVLP